VGSLYHRGAPIFCVTSYFFNITSDVQCSWYRRQNGERYRYYFDYAFYSVDI
jgi:hypothetical protein